MQTLRRVWAQRFAQRHGQTQVRQKTVACTDLIVTPHDVGGRAGEKRGQSWHGDKVHVTETAEPDTPTFITDVTTAPAPSGDSAALPTIRQHRAERDLLPAEQYVDASYVSGPQLAHSQARGIDLVGPPRPDTSPQAFKIADFRIERATKQAWCPQGHPCVN